MLIHVTILTNHKIRNKRERDEIQVRDFVCVPLNTAFTALNCIIEWSVCVPARQRTKGCAPQGAFLIRTAAKTLSLFLWRLLVAHQSEPLALFFNKETPTFLLQSELVIAFLLLTVCNVWQVIQQLSTKFCSQLNLRSSDSVWLGYFRKQDWIMNSFRKFGLLKLLCTKLGFAFTNNKRTKDGKQANSRQFSSNFF